MSSSMDAQKLNSNKASHTYSKQPISWHLNSNKETDFCLSKTRITKFELKQSSSHKFQKFYRLIHMKNQDNSEFLSLKDKLQKVNVCHLKTMNII